MSHDENAEALHHRLNEYATTLLNTWKNSGKTAEEHVENLLTTPVQDEGEYKVDLTSWKQDWAASLLLYYFQETYRDKTIDQLENNESALSARVLQQEIEAVVRDWENQQTWTEYSSSSNEFVDDSILAAQDEITPDLTPAQVEHDPTPVTLREETLEKVAETCSTIVMEILEEIEEHIELTEEMEDEVIALFVEELARTISEKYSA